MTSITERQLDEPVTLPEDDDFGRDSFAKYLAQFIVDAPRESSIRIGVLAAWGEGKTSVLRLTAHHLRAAGADVVIVPSWGGHSVSQIQHRILREVRTVLKIADTAPRKARSLVGRLLGEGRAAAGPLRAEIADQVGYGNLALKAAELIAAEMDAHYEQQMRKIIADRGARRLVVMLDDLDRAEPAAIPNLLMSVREAMALPNVTYVLALSPDVLRDALKDTGLGVVSADRFLEKIVEYPFRLRVPSEAGWEAALWRMIRRMPDLPGSDAVWSVREHLPRNPRRLKLFLRMLAANRTFLARFDAAELPWDIVHLTFLLRLEFPDCTQSLQESQEILSSMSFTDAYWRAVRLNSAKKDEPAPEPEEAIPPTHHPERERFLSLCRAIKEAGASWASAYDLSAILDISSGVATMTRREAAEIVRALQMCTPNTWADTIRSRAAALGSSWQASAPRLWHWILYERELALESLVDASTPDQVKERILPLEHLTNVVELLVRDLGVVALKEVGLDMWIGWVEHCSRWAHFVNEKDFAEMRVRERQIIDAATSSADPSTVIRIASGFRRGGSPLSMSKDFEELLDAIKGRASLLVRDDLRSAFTAAGGVRALLAQGQGDARRDVLADADGPFFTPDNVTWFKELVAEAATPVRAAELAPVRENLGVYVRALDLALRGEIPLGQPRKVLEMPGMLELLWKGSVAQPLTYRAAGTLDSIRAKLIENQVATEAQMPLPGWWQFGSNSGSPSAAP